MKKYTKEITALLTLVTAGVIGGSVYAADTQDIPTAGVPVISREEDITKKAGDSVCTTETTPELLMGDVMIVDTEPARSTTPTTYSTTPMMGTQIYPVTTTPVTQPSTTPATYSTTLMMGTQINPVTTTPVTLPPQRIPVRGRGDIDGSGWTDLSDLLKASMYVLGDIDLNETQLIEADMTKDGVVDIADLPAMRMKIMTPDPADPGIIPPDTTDPEVTTPVSTTPVTPFTQTTKETTYVTYGDGRFGIKRGPDKTEYKIGESFDITGTVVYGGGDWIEGTQHGYWDLFETVLTPDTHVVDIDTSEFNNQVPGTYKITLNFTAPYFHDSATITVTVVE